MSENTTAKSLAEITPKPEKPLFITTPIYYVNGDPHVGHLYTSLLADSYTRFARLREIPMFFLSGIDEHGQKVGQSAAEKNIEPKAWCDIMNDNFLKFFENVSICPDRFIRTTDKDHEEAVFAVWNKLKANDDIYKGKYEGWYCLSDEAFVPELNVQDVTDPVTGKVTKMTIDSNRPVEWLVEENYMFRLSKYQQPLLDWIDANPTCIVPEFRRNEIYNFVKSGLNDISVSRKSVKWGIPVPDDPSHTIYVWIDALANYITAAGYPGDIVHLDEQHQICQSKTKITGLSVTKPVWPADIQIVGKDIIKFHAIYWPAFLLALNLPVYKKLVVHGWWTKDRMKISKSAGNQFEIPDELKIIGGPFAVDAFRYILLKESNISIDCDYSLNVVKSIVNADLADQYGNLLLRCTAAAINPAQIVPVPPPSVLDAKYHNLVEVPAEAPANSPLTLEDLKLIAKINSTAALVDAAMWELDTQAAIGAICSLNSVTNGYVQTNEPWKLAKQLKDKPDNAEIQTKLSTILYLMIEAVRVASTLLLPFMPSAAAYSLDRLAIPAENRTVQHCHFGVAQPGTKIDGKRDPLFPKILETEAAPKAQPAKPKPAKGGKNASEEDKQAALDQSFAMCKFQMIKLTDCKKHPDADKLIVCTAHLSETETSTLVTGLIPHYQPEDLEGRVVCSVVNLKPKKMMGIEGHVMLLAATDKVSGKCILLQPPEGSQIGDRIYPTGFTLAEGWKEGDVATAQKATTQEAAEVPKGRFEKVVNGFKVETELPKFYGKPLVTSRGPIKIEGICDGSEFH
ncbi:putative Methionine--tRNA ligase [Blattamonas nauphoetae]|uniref:methionine--tRNA ligase n=1 Tax=Blattamonas nauphoetae TaxID=2049346 RepID=A0ABQ9YC56_9EUKA|nr:putative Methionine--tRNA ligase [Blattamonas nauphoetae]